MIAVFEEKYNLILLVQRTKNNLVIAECYSAECAKNNLQFNNLIAN